MESFRKSIGKYISLPIYFAALYLFDFFFRLIYRDSGYFGVSYWVPCIFSLLWSFILTAVAFFLKGKARRIYMISVAAFFGLFDLAHAVVKLVSGSFISFSDMAFVEDGASFISLEYFKVSPWVYVLFFSFILITVFAALIIPNERYDILWLKVTVLSVSAVCFGFLIFMNWYFNVNYNASSDDDGFRWTDTYDITDPTVIYSEFSNADQGFLMTGSYQYIVRSIAVSVVEPIFMDNDVSDLDEYFNNRNIKQEKNDMTGIFKDKNAICILLESIDTWMIRPEFMPNLYNIQQESINFENHYTPLFLSAGTYNTEFAFNCGFYLPSTGTNAKTYATGVYPNSIANLFNKQGYVSKSYHLLNGKYYNRKVVHKLWGYESYNTLQTLGVGTENSLDSTLMKAYDYMFGSDKNFSYVISYSGHGPYNSGMKHISDEHIDQAIEAVENCDIDFPSADTKQQFIYCIAHIMETDKFLGELVDQMKADGHIDDTVLVIFGDHWSKYLTDKQFVMDLKGVEDDNMLCHTPFMIYSGDTYKYKDIEKVTSSVDIIPTVCNLFGIEYDARYFIGADAYSDNGGYVAFKNYSWYDGNIYYTENYEGPESDYVKNRNKEVYEMLNASWKVVRKNYFKLKEK